MPTNDELEAARLRRDNAVSYRDMVEFVSSSIADFHAARAETLVQLEARLVDHATLNRSELLSTRDAIRQDLNSMRETFRADLGGITAQLEEHTRWHRDELASVIARSPALRIAAVSLVFTAVTTIGALIALILTHGGL